MEFQDLISSSIEYIFIFIPILLPFALGLLLFNLWVNFARERFLSSQKYTLIRIIPPKEIIKTPAAMELFITSLHQTGGEATPLDVFWRGKSRPWFTLEIASNGGEVGFFIWTRVSFQKFIEAQIYAQYPGIEVIEVEDYARDFEYESGKYEMFGLEYKLTDVDPVPIRTYVDYGLDKASEETEKVDPITSTIEFLGSLRRGENAWIQIMIKAHKKEDKKKGTWFGKTDNWVDQAKEQVEKIRKESFTKDPKNPTGPSYPTMSKVKEEKINAIEKSVTKLGFDTGIRAIYIAEKESFSGINIPGLIGSFKQYGSSNLNGFKPAITTSFDYFWQDPFGKRVKKLKAQMLEDFKKRVYFGTEIDKKNREKFVLNTEELATIFHFPGGVASTPTMSRVQSRKGEAPSNLPIQ